MLITELAHPDNTFLTVNPVDRNVGWYASVSLLGNDVYEIERHHPGQQRATRTTSTDSDKIARGLTIWLADRFPSP